MVKKIKFNLEQLDQVVHDYIVPLLTKYSIFTFTGPLGAGKTTMIRNILRQAGVKGDVTSPTFGYVNSYAVGDVNYNHFDLYRITAVDEFINMGFDEYLAKNNNVNFIEWPEVIQQLLKSPELGQNVCTIKIGYVVDDPVQRELEITVK